MDMTKALEEAVKIASKKIDSIEAELEYWITLKETAEKYLDEDKRNKD